jgi:GNAT superfamily N-acetyltransferase
MQLIVATRVAGMTARLTGLWVTGMTITVRQAETADVEVVAAILTEAAEWLDGRGMAMWRADELTPERVLRDVAAGLFFLAERSGQPVGTLKFQLSDQEFWPDVPETDAAFIHRLAVRRESAGGTVSSALLSWAAHRTSSLGRQFLRLDCEASRPRLRAVYERFGFRHHSDRQVGPYFVARYQLEVNSPRTDVSEGPAFGR